MQQITTVFKNILIDIFFSSKFEIQIPIINLRMKFRINYMYLDIYNVFEM